MATTNPTALSKTTRFAPPRIRSYHRPPSRSPSRSPVRVSQFLAREIDPLLNNLSPDSTLKALRDTSTIAPDGTGQDALAKSIADVSPAERQIGIRAAVAAQKLKQWRQEVEQWTWPGRRERARGAGFMLPRKSSTDETAVTHRSHFGSLPTETAYAYEERIEDIRDGMEALDLEDIKDHVFSSHAPQQASATTKPPLDRSESSYGRMRDFTALITATVVQALPDMAQLNILLDTWEIRLTVLRQIPNVEGVFKSTRAGVQTAMTVLRDPKTGPLVTLPEVETAKTLLGDMVSSLGGKVDRLLDALEGQEDTLPQEWIDTLEDIENEYAAWVVEAEHVAIQNDLRNQSTPPVQETREAPTELPAEETRFDPEQSPGRSVVRFASLNNHDKMAANNDAPKAADSILPPPTVVTPLAELPATSSPSRYPFLATDPLESPHRRKPSLKVRTGHQRDVSEVSMAGSAFSGMSDISQAEIVDARSTQVLSSPPISLVDNRFSRDERGMTGSGYDLNLDSPPRLLQRASTASIEVIPKEQVRQVNLNRSQSHEMLGTITQSPPETPSKALRKLTGADSPEKTTEHEATDPFTSTAPNGSVVRPALSTHPSAMVDPLLIRPKGVDQNGYLLPDVPRKSSKRVSMSASLGTATPPSPLNENAVEGSNTIGNNRHTMPARGVEANRRGAIETKSETLEDKIKDILVTMPTKIRLANEPDDIDHGKMSSQPSSRSSTPGPVLTLSPVKSDRMHRKAAPGDIREFHLTKAGQARDIPPVKLFVRAVGEHGERVMVRVGGGWADLGEYLREYSLHHGHRGLADGNLEVANFPGGQPVRDSSTVPTITSSNSNTRPDIAPDQSGKTRSFSSGSFRFGSWSGLGIGKSRKGSQSKAIDHDETVNVTQATRPMPTAIQGHNVQHSHPTPISPVPRYVDANPNQSRTASSPYNGQMHSNTPSNIITPTNHSNRYTPLGAAGPKTQVRRVMSHSTVQSNNSDAWINGTVGKPRAVGNNTTTVHGPTITTTTTVTSRSTPAGRRVSSVAQLRPISNAGTASPASLTSTSGPVTPVSSNLADQKARNRSSISDMSGIRRVFLRRKSSK